MLHLPRNRENVRGQDQILTHGQLNYMLAAGVGMRIWRPESEDLFIFVPEGMT